MLIAICVGTDGKRSVLGVSTALSEAEVHGREFFSSIVARSICGTRFIVSDAHLGLAAALLCEQSDEWLTSKIDLNMNSATHP